MTAWAMALLAGALAAEGATNVVGTQELGPGVEEVRQCAERNAPKTSARQEIVLSRTGKGGDSLALRAQLFWKRGEDDRSRVLVRVEEPPDERGTAFLLIEKEGRNDMFSYLPEFKKVRRITTHTLSGSFLGTDFSYEDVEELQRVADHAKVERLPDASLDGRPTYVLVGTPAPDSGSAYRKVVSHVDREACVLRQVEFYGAGEEPVKVLQVPWSDVRQQDGRWIPHRAILADRDKGSETTLTLEKVELDVEIPDKMFSETELMRGGR